MSMTNLVAFKATYNFTVDGGAQGTITPAITSKVPQSFVVTGVIIDEITNATGGGGCTFTINAGATALTGAIGVASIADTQPTLAGSVGCIPISASGNITVTIGAADATAGKFNITVQGYFAKLS